MKRFHSKLSQARWASLLVVVAQVQFGPKIISNSQTGVWFRRKKSVAHWCR